MRIALNLAAAILLLTAGSCKKDKKSPAPTPPSTPPPTADVSTSLDMRYTVTGTMQDFTNSTYSGAYPCEMTLEKAGTNQGRILPKELGIPGHLILIGGSKSYYSQFAIVVTFDPTSYKISGITNHYGQPASNGRFATLDPSGVNAWDPATKSIKLKYWLDDTALTIPHRASFDETWTYLGAK